LHRAVWIRRSRISGYLIPMDEMSSIEYECLLMLDDYFEAYERNIRLTTVELLKFNAGLK
jgi:hypothetical protein